MKVWVELTTGYERSISIDTNTIMVIDATNMGTLLHLHTGEDLCITVKESREEVKRLIKEAYRKAEEEE